MRRVAFHAPPPIGQEEVVDEKLLDGRLWTGATLDGELPKLAYLLPCVRPGLFRIRIWSLRGELLEETQAPVQSKYVGRWLINSGFAFANATWTPEEMPEKVEAKEEDSRGTVYFMRMLGSPFMKIGCSVDPVSRMLELQIGSPLELFIIHTEPGGWNRERALQRKFREHCVRGEWFRWTKEIENYIKEALKLTD